MVFKALTRSLYQNHGCGFIKLTIDQNLHCLRNQGFCVVLPNIITGRKWLAIRNL